MARPRVKEKRTFTIKAHVTPEEYARLKYDAGRFSFTMSDYVRRVMTEFKIPQSVVDARAIVDLFKVSADLARLGNLFKMALDDDGFQATGTDTAQVHKLIKDIEDTRQCLFEQIRNLRKK